MKKITFLFVAAFFICGTFAQSFQQLTHQQPQEAAIGKYAPIIKNTKSNNERWYNFGQTMDAFFNGDSKLYANNLFPDSTILVQYQDGPGTPWIHALGDVLDVTSTFFNNPLMHHGQLAMDENSSFTLDSIAMICIYERNTADPGIVDTLVFEVVVNYDLSTWMFTSGDVPANLGVDTVFFKGLEYSHINNDLDIPVKMGFKLPLTDQSYADSLSNGLHYFAISTQTLPAIQAGKYVGLSVSFIPGYTWNAHTDFITDKNRVRFISFKQLDGMFPFYTKRDFNVSYIVPKDVRYNMANSWNGRYIPSFAYMGNQPTYRYEHHWILYKTTCVSGCGSVGIETTFTTEYALGEAYPNPATHGASLNIPVNTNSNNSRIIIRNILGQTIMSIDNIPQGNGVYEINTRELQAGIYFYTLESGNNVTTKKFTIQ